ncbi:telomere repeat-binding protein 1-like [Selaginella moellendorffii]|uniref:telomere repeat-binding protein 1-like n=1 Tax=Selaginella moellendorffii TaxID=88036 RepID=UPI000D1CB08C|nr:telomere repeat-binding protein 1-like [Selaginella moellendorffii]|eukprot:XP_024520366.1 telomere repeat-binding protein 1-like [Selaginella moellendorffii]
MVSLRQKQLTIEGTKRRIRRPFTISEVEALVYAVEKLGLGRWRDVKLWAFDQAKHRTYVDLKVNTKKLSWISKFLSLCYKVSWIFILQDKWKTLVHTARIAPHQRRGEPVPQELLERVIRAQNYWTARQAKQQAELDF